MNFTDIKGRVSGKGNHLSEGSEATFMLCSRRGGSGRSRSDYHGLIDHQKNFGFYSKPLEGFEQRSGMNYKHGYTGHSLGNRLQEGKLGGSCRTGKGQLRVTRPGR